MASAVGLPRVGALGILEGAEGAEALVGYVRESVGEVDVRWIEEASRGEWKGSKVVVS
jgi:ribonuclease P/MRP protein subunit POP3